MLWNGVCAEKVREAFAKLSYREQTMLEKRSAICMTCGRVSPLSERVSFEDLAIEFEASSPRTAERAYHRAVEMLTLNLVGLGALHAVRIEHIAPETYRYQADNDGDWGEFALDAETGELQIISLAELDTTKTHRFAQQAVRYLRYTWVRSCQRLCWRRLSEPAKVQRNTTPFRQRVRQNDVSFSEAPR